METKIANVPRIFSDCWHTGVCDEECKLPVARRKRGCSECKKTFYPEQLAKNEGSAWCFPCAKEKELVKQKAILRRKNLANWLVPNLPVHDLVLEFIGEYESYKSTPACCGCDPAFDPDDKLNPLINIVNGEAGNEPF